MKGQYNKWLTPPITAELQNDSIIILTPKEFADKFNQLSNKFLDIFREFKLYLTILKVKTIFIYK